MSIFFRKKEKKGFVLIEEGLITCRKMGAQAVFVLGEPEYYTRFGFELASKKGLYYKSEKFLHIFRY